MKNINKLNKMKILILLMMFSYGVDIFTYTFTLSNYLIQDVKVKLYADGVPINKEYRLIKKGGKAEIESNELCLTKILAKKKFINSWLTPREVLILRSRKLDVGPFCRSETLILRPAAASRPLGSPSIVAYPI